MTNSELDLACKYTARIESDSNGYVVKIPDREIDYGPLQPGQTVRVGIEHVKEGSATSTDGSQTPPVSEGERYTVEIEDIGERGDGIARIDQGYVLIVPDTELGEEVKVKVTQVNPNYGFAEVIDIPPVN